MFKDFSDTIYKYKYQYLLFIVFFAYFCFGIFPFEYYETDALGIISGSKKMLETNTFGENYYTYGFNVQVGTYFWVLFLHKISNLDLKACSSILSAIFGILFFLFSTKFISKFTKISYPVCGLILLLFQEIYSSWYYMNAATGAAFFMIVGILFITRTNITAPKVLLSALFLAIAAWTKLDVMILFPVVLFVIESKSFKNKLFASLIIGVITLIILFFLYRLSNVESFYNILLGKGGTLSFSENQSTAEGVGYSQIVRAIIGYFSLLILFLIVLGSYKLFQQKEWQLLLISVVPFLFFLLIINGRFVSGKHLLYYCPFFSIPIAFLYGQFRLKKIFQQSWSKIFLVLLFCQYFIGIQVYFKKYPYIQQNYSSLKPFPKLFNIFSITLKNEKIEKVELDFGGGLKLATSDEMLLSSGIFFSPIMWNNLKQGSGDDYTLLADYINRTPKDTLYITTSQGGIYPLKNILYINDFTLLNPGTSYSWGGEQHTYLWEKNNKYVIIDQDTYPKDYGLYIEKLRMCKQKSFLHIAFWDWERWYLNENQKFVKKVNNVAYKFE
jgi:hypothetical protein